MYSNISHWIKTHHFTMDNCIFNYYWLHLSDDKMEINWYPFTQTVSVNGANYCADKIIINYNYFNDRILNTEPALKLNNTGINKKKKMNVFNFESYQKMLLIMYDVIAFITWKLIETSFWAVLLSLFCRNMVRVVYNRTVDTSCLVVHHFRSIMFFLTTILEGGWYCIHEILKPFIQTRTSNTK